ncbi:MAG: class II fructose-bisphosphate aldolase [Thermodesulfobacteriota bacterium]
MKGEVLMQHFNSIEELHEFTGESIAEHIDKLVETAVFNKNGAVKVEARSLIRSAAAELGIKLNSIQTLYEAMGRGEESGLTVPAINIRGLTYDTGRAIFRAASNNNASAIIFEIAKSEIGYTDQRPSEYAVVLLAAAIKEGYRGPVFVQGDHFQVNAKNYAVDPEKETNALKELINEAVSAGFYNIDIDASTTVDLDKPTVPEQQKLNYEITATLTEYIRGLDSNGITVSVGGEIGEVGSKNSTEEELRAYMEGLNKILEDKGIKGISKISVQTGTSHGGVVLPDGSIAEVKVDFDTIERLSKVSREEFGLAGVVQHGASTLPDDFFHVFVEKNAAEVHLATGFQNQIYDSPNLPAELKDEIYKYLNENHSGEKSEGQTDEQFIYKTRKKGFGPFKEKFWNLPGETRDKIGGELEDRFDMLFKKLSIVGSADIIKKYYG